MMDKDDVTLQNSNHNTTLYLAAAAGNVEAVKIMVNKNRALLTIAGSNGTMMPLYTAALFGNHDVVKYLYENSYELGDIGWDPQNRVFTAISSKMIPSEKEHEALQLLRIIWNDIAKKPKREIDDILRGPFEWKQNDKPTPGNVEQAVGNQNVIRGPSATKKTYPSRILFVAAEKGNTKFVVELPSVS
nr:hypothetical protein [Tanacetum cinerariifolium]